jgi:hypothetical protein
VFLRIASQKGLHCIAPLKILCWFGPLSSIEFEKLREEIDSEKIQKREFRYNVLPEKKLIILILIRGGYSSPKLWAHFVEVVHCRPRENALDAIAIIN